MVLLDPIEFQYITDILCMSVCTIIPNALNQLNFLYCHCICSKYSLFAPKYHCIHPKYHDICPKIPPYLPQIILYLPQILRYLPQILLYLLQILLYFPPNNIVFALNTAVFSPITTVFVPNTIFCQILLIIKVLLVRRTYMSGSHLIHNRPYGHGAA